MIQISKQRIRIRSFHAEESADLCNRRDAEGHVLGEVAVVEGFGADRPQIGLVLGQRIEQIVMLLGPEAVDAGQHIVDFAADGFGDGDPLFVNADNQINRCAGSAFAIEGEGLGVFDPD